MEKNELKIQANHAYDTLRNTMVSALGLGVADGFLKYRSNLKRKRIFEFSETFHSLLEKSLGRAIEPNDVTHEVFVDAFECIMQRVQMTNSELKLDRFRNILLRRAMEPSTSDFMGEKYIQLIEVLNEVQLVMLEKLKDQYRIDEKSELLHLLRDRKTLDANGDIQWRIAEMQVGDEVVKLDQNKINFLFNDMISYGLIERLSESYEEKLREAQNAAMATIGGDGTLKVESPKEYYRVSQVGKNFLSYISSN